MFKCNYKTLKLCFNAFHDAKVGDMPEYGDYVLLELKDGRHSGCGCDHILFADAEIEYPVRKI